MHSPRNRYTQMTFCSYILIQLLICHPRHAKKLKFNPKIKIANFKTLSVYRCMAVIVKCYVNIVVVPKCYVIIVLVAKKVLC